MENNTGFEILILCCCNCANSGGSVGKGRCTDYGAAGNEFARMLTDDGGHCDVIARKVIVSLSMQRGLSCEFKDPCSSC